MFTRLTGRGRLIVPDLIGFGDSGRPDIAYELDDHIRYLDAWFDALELDNVTLVVQDYGAAFGVSWAARHSDRVKAVLLAEPVIRDIASADLPEPFVQAQQLIRTPGDGEKFVVEDNLFLTQVLPGAFLTPPAQEDLDVYLAPFPTAESRGHLIKFPRNLPIDGNPASSVDFLERSVDWLKTSNDVPKLLLTFEPGFLLTPPEILAWATENIAAPRGPSRRRGRPLRPGRAASGHRRRRPRPAGACRGSEMSIADSIRVADAVRPPDPPLNSMRFSNASRPAASSANAPTPLPTSRSRGSKRHGSAHTGSRSPRAEPVRRSASCSTSSSG